MSYNTIKKGILCAFIGMTSLIHAQQDVLPLNPNFNFLESLFTIFSEFRIRIIGEADLFREETVAVLGNLPSSEIAAVNLALNNNISAIVDETALFFNINRIQLTNLLNDYLTAGNLYLVVLKQNQTGSPDARQNWIQKANSLATFYINLDPFLQAEASTLRVQFIESVNNQADAADQYENGLLNPDSDGFNKSMDFYLNATGNLRTISNLISEAALRKVVQ